MMLKCFQNVTIAIPVLNEEKNLSDCLKSVSQFENVMVIDSGSVDQTLEICRSFSCKVLNFNWNGSYPKKRNWFLLNEFCTTDWVLFLDADERITPEFVNELDCAIQNQDLVGYWIRYSNYFMGEELKFGVPQRKLALFRYGAGIYEKVEHTRNGSLDMEIHEHPVLDGPVSEIKEKIFHLDHNPLDRFITKHIEYAKWECDRFEYIYVKSSDVSLTFRQRMKYALLGRSWFFALYFLYNYFVRLSVLDGFVGFNYSFFKAFYFRLIYLYIRSARVKR